MADRTFYNEILTEHNIRPEFKHDLPDADIVLEGVNPSCGDDIWLKLNWMEIRSVTEPLSAMDVPFHRHPRILCLAW